MRRVLLLLLFGPTVAMAQVPSLMQRAQSAVQQYERGERDAAMREFDRFIEVYNAGPERLSSQDLVAVAIACTYLGARDPQLFKDAVLAYDRAIARDPGNMDARVRVARLFLDKYNFAEAKRTLDAALQVDANHVPALVTEARRRSTEGLPGADSVLARALKIAPDDAEAHLLRARYHADVEEFALAKQEVVRAVRADRDNADVLAFGYALTVVSEDTLDHSFARRFVQLYPKDARAHVAAADLLARVRQYSAAADMAREAVELDSTDWRALTSLGLNLLRIGRVDEAQQALEKSFARDPYNLWVKNTLDLLDTFDEYDVITHGPFRFVIEKPESALLSLYLTELMERAHTTFVARYGFTPTPPIRMEVYRSHADFSVRTVGLAGLGALGVSFGNTVAFDSPAAKDAGPFTWGSTAWHELAHTFTLGATDMRIPRWFSEGLSVFEERRARKGWGQRVSPEFLHAYRAGRLVRASRLNDGFVRPQYPRQVIFSYYQASLVCEMIAEQFGERAIAAMLKAYRDGLATDQVISRVLKLDLATFDKRFDEYVRGQFGHALAALGEQIPGGRASAAQNAVSRARSEPRNYGLQLAAGRDLLQRGETAAAVEHLERARALFPEYAGEDSPYPLLVSASLNQGDKRATARLLQAMLDRGEGRHHWYLMLGDLLLELGDTARAADALEGAMYVNPYDIEQHARLASVYASLKQHAKAVRERRAVLALNPVDKADAHFQLALAYRDAGDAMNARRAVLRALEIAPHYQQAQQLLLSLRRPP